MTTLLKDAKEAGACYMNGKYMLLFQGAAAFQIWTGEKMPISYIKETCFS
jgi:shikimate dehydrogenase